MSRWWAPSEVPLPLAVLHRGLGDAVIATGVASVGNLRGRSLRDYLRERACRGFDRARAAHVPDRAVAHARGERLLALHELHVGADGIQHAVAAEDFALVSEVNRWHLQLLLGDVLPHVELCPIGDRKDARVLPFVQTPIVETPHLRPLALRLPLTELVAEREDALLGASTLLVAPCATEGGIEAVLANRIQQRHGLQRVARGARAGLLDDATAPDGLLNRGHDQGLTNLAHPPVAELERLGEVVARVDVHNRKGKA